MDNKRPEMTPKKAHEIAVRAATAMVKEGMEAGLSWSDIAVAGETVIAIVVAGAAEVSGTPNRARFAQEIVEAMTERAHELAQRIIAEGRA